jgi:hypothetical protein
MAISITDIGKLLGVGSTHLGYLCSNQHGKTNRYSKYKPMRIAGLKEPTEAQMMEANYGYSIPEMMSVSNALNIVDGTSSVSAPSDYSLELSPSCGWWYYPPTGETAAPFRQGDFREYDGESTCVFGGVDNQGSVTTSATSDVIFTLSLSNNFSFADFGSLDGFHFGVILRGNSKTVFVGKEYGENSVYIEKGTIDDLLGSGYGSYDVIPIATTYSDNTTHYTEATCVPLPCERSVITYSNASPDTGLGFGVFFEQVTTSAAGARITFTAKFYLWNDGSATTTVNLANLYFKVLSGSDYNCSDYSTDYLSEGLTGSVSVPAGGQTDEYTSALRDSLTNYDNTFYYKIEAYYNTAAGYVQAGVTEVFKGSKGLDDI